MFEVAVIVVLIVINGFLVMSEIAIVSSRKVRLEKKAQEGSRAAAVALKLANKPQRTLSTIQFFITLSGFIAAAYGGNELSGPLANYFRHFPLLAKHAAALGFAVVVALTTYLSLVIGEIVPKTIALAKPELMAVRTAPMMQLLGWISAPIVLFLQVSTKLILNLFGFKGNTEPPVTEEELQHMIEQGSEHGVIEESESQMVKGVFRIGDRKVSALMTHRSEMVWLDAEASEDTVRELLRTSIHSSFPVCNGSLDKIIGVAFIKDIATQLADRQPMSLKKILKQPLFVPENMDALELLEQFKQSHMHTGFVVNEYGTVEGIVTFHDILEAIVGDVPDAATDTEQMVVQRGDGSWLIDGSMQVDEWTDVLRLRHLNENELGAYNTLGGFVMHRLGRIPQTSDRFAFKGYDFEVMDMDGRRVDKVLVTKQPEAEDED